MANATTTQAPTVIQPRAFTPKRGVKSLTLTLVDKGLVIKPHHQKTLILELLESSEDKSMALNEMIGTVEADEKLWTRLQSKQSVFNCITYHMKDLAKIGAITVK